MSAAFTGSYEDGYKTSFTAQVIARTYPVDSEMSDLLQRVYDEPEVAGITAVELALGEEYCERVRRCGGVLLRDGSPAICSALDPESFEPLLRKYYEDQT
jgi:hypothetical protein